MRNRIVLCSIGVCCLFNVAGYFVPQTAFENKSGKMVSLLVGSSAAYVLYYLCRVTELPTFSKRLEDYSAGTFKTNDALMVINFLTMILGQWVFWSGNSH